MSRSNIVIGPGAVRGGKGRPLYRGLLVCFTIIFTASIALLYAYDVRPLAYFILMTALALILLFEILFAYRAGDRPGAILVQIMAFTLNLIWGVTLNYYFFIGRTDTLSHVWWAQSVLDLGHVTDALDVYRPFPLWHILNAAVYQVSGLGGPISRVLFINCGLVYAVLGTLGIFLLVKKVSGNERLALLSALFLSFNTTFLFYGMYSISRSIVMVLFVLLMLLLADRQNGTKQWLAYGLSFAMIVYHTVSSLFIIPVLLLIYFIQNVFIKTKENPLVSLRFILLFAGMTFAYWAANANNIIWAITDSVLQSSAGATGLQTSSIYDTPLNEMLNYSQYSFFILFILAGALLLFRIRYWDVRLRVLAVTAVAMIPLSFPGPLFLLNTLASTVSIGRFEEYTFPFMVVTAAAGFYLLYLRKSKLITLSILLLLVAMVFLSLTNDFVASDNPLVKRPFYTYYLQGSEVTGLDRVANATDGSVMSDYIASRYYLSSPYLDKTHILEVDKASGELLKGNVTDVILLRDGELGRRPLKLYTSTSGFIPGPNWLALDYYYRDDPAYGSLGNKNRIYGSGSISAYS
ncbi:MAG TPA: hypothetical protein VMC61_06870 [Methanocella sp.]|nr:hypothetical protein [Methanocella sp.]